MSSSLRVKDALKWGHDSGKLLDAECLLSYVMGCSKEQLFAYPEKEVSIEERESFEALWRRRDLGEPVAYLTGNKEFYGLNFKVDSRVLIPRPETEHLVETVLDLVKDIEEPRILDLGTGSGAMAVSLAHTLPKAVVYASDVSAEAVAVAQENARLNEVDVEFSVSDLLCDLPWQDWDLDVLVANLPYIGTERFHFVEKGVEDHEPHVALFGGSDGLDLYRQLFEQINSSASGRPRWILGEFGSMQRSFLEDVINTSFPDGRVEFHQDLAGLDRFFVIYLR